MTRKLQTPAIHTDWPQLCKESDPKVKEDVFVAFLEKKWDKLKALKKQFPDLFCKTAERTLIPASVFMRGDKKRFENVLSSDIFGIIEIISFWQKIAIRLGIPSPICIEDEEITSDILKQLTGQSVQFGMRVVVNGTAYFVVFTNIYSVKNYGKKAPKKPHNQNPFKHTGIIILLERCYINLKG